MNIIAVDVAGTNIQLKEHPLVWMPTGFGITLARVLENYFKPGMKGLELGLGSGILSILAGIKGMEMVGLDINQDAVKTASQNWEFNNLVSTRYDFRLSNLFSALKPNELGTFDIIWSNPPVLPGLPDDKFQRDTRDEYELAGTDGRLVLDAMIQESGKWLQPDGKMIVIATSLQSWEQTQSTMNQHWEKWKVIATKVLELTSECTPKFIEFWLRRQKEDGEQRIYKKDERWLHDLWFIEASNPKIV